MKEKNHVKKFDNTKTYHVTLTGEQLNDLCSGVFTGVFPSTLVDGLMGSICEASETPPVPTELLDAYKVGFDTIVGLNGRVSLEVWRDPYEPKVAIQDAWNKYSQ
jgi:hypothetical protein